MYKTDSVVLVFALFPFLCALFPSSSSHPPPLASLLLYLSSFLSPPASLLRPPSSVLLSPFSLLKREVVDNMERMRAQLLGGRAMVLQVRLD